MIKHFIDIIRNLTREDLRIILSILSLITRIIFKVVCFYQEKNTTENVSVRNRLR